jgi:hypothetical protein
MDEYPAGADHPATSQDRLINKLFVIRRESKAYHRRNPETGVMERVYELVWVVMRNVEAGWPWPTSAWFDSWDAAMLHIDNEIDTYTIPELKLRGYSLRRAYDGPSALSSRMHYVCRHDARVRSKARVLVVRKGERAAWRAAWKHYKGEL